MNEKEIWRYESQDKTHINVVCEIEPCILINYPTGTLHEEGTHQLFNFFKEYSEKMNKKIMLLIDNSKVKSIDIRARKFVVEFVKEKSPIKKAATFGTNIFMENLISLFAAIMSKMSLVHHAFNNKENAFSWLKKE